MNQDQRKFLIRHVEDTFNKQRDKLVKPEPPNLNNYLVAAVLDNTIKYKSIDVLKKRIRQIVIDLGPAESFITAGDGWRRKHSYDDDEYRPQLAINPEIIFEYPKAFLEAEKEYCHRKEVYEEQIAMLEDFRDTITLKIQIGSNQVLEKLIEDVDSMGDLRIINKRLMLGGGQPQKQIAETSTKLNRRGKQE